MAHSSAPATWRRAPDVRVLVTWASKRGGTEGLARIVAETLARNGLQLVTRAAAAVRELDDVDAVIVGGAHQGTIAPVGQVLTLMERVGAQGHGTFGGRLAPDAEGFPARAMAKKLSGDWRNPERVRAWAEQVAGEVAEARPRPTVEPAARGLGRLLVHAVAGWIRSTRS